MNIQQLFKQPSIISIIGNTHTGKSNTAHSILQSLSNIGTYKLYTYGFRAQPDIEHTEIHSIEELEQIQNSIIFLDELMSLWDLDNRMAKRSIESTLRLIYHNNNILVLIMLPENCKKFIAGKIHIAIFKKCTIADFINGSRIKHMITSYKGMEIGNSVLNLAINEALIYNGEHYYKVNIPYIETKDSKKDNCQIVKENVNKNV